MVLRFNKLIGPLLQNDHRKRIEQPESEASVSENESVEDYDCECLEYESWEDAPLEVHLWKMNLWKMHMSLVKM